MEAAWLAAMMVTPVFFNIYSSRIFEPEKLAVLRSLALLILACWLLKLYEEGGRITAGGGSDKPFWKNLLKLPLLPWVFALALVFILSTLFSVSPQVSLWGSYPRLQGAYTTFSYLVIFGAMIANLRRRAQVERLIGVFVLTSLPVSLYGLLQRFQIDPIPWGGDVSLRIASTLGNSIFVAAYLIMAFPLTMMRIVESFEALVNEQGSTLPNFVRATSYVFIAALQGIAIYYSGSRGPWLGWAAGLVVIWLGLSLIWRKRWLTWSGVAVALLAGGFLVVLNIPGGPLESLRNRPEFGRLGQLLDAESRTGKVRTLIWQGAAELVQLHEPLEFPDGRSDGWNFLRPIIGYGPESMYVAYNRFYPPELAQVEKRNASPDRSHNETWDSLVMTGLLGLVVYLGLFGSVLYFGFKWLGLVRGARQRNLFLLLYLIGGIASTLIFALWKGVPYLGVALPFGLVLGVGVYLLLSSLVERFESAHTALEKTRQYILLGLIAAIVAHFVEINFGIAIAVTRLYFWTFTGLLFLVGYWLPRQGEYLRQPVQTAVDEPVSVQAAPTAAIQASERKSGAGAQERKNPGKPGRAATGASRRKHPTPQNEPSSIKIQQPLRQMATLALVLAILLITLGYNYITNSQRSTSVIGVIWAAFTQLNTTGQFSFGVLALVFTTWLIGAAMLVSETMQEQGTNQQNFPYTKILGGVLAASLLAAGIFWLAHATSLVQIARVSAANLQQVLDQVRRSEGLVGQYYLALLLVVLCLGFFLGSGAQARQRWRSQASPILAGAAFVLVLILALTTNLRIVQADVAFKTAELFAKPDTWPVAIAIYERANELAPAEDYYYLFLGRAYLEYAKTISDPAQNEALMTKAAQDLRKAQQINPLNTDHTANLARLYSMWASTTGDAQTRLERARSSEAYFAGAVALSPNNARLWDEWAMLSLNILDEPDQAYLRLQQALQVDEQYDFTYALLGDYYSRFEAAKFTTAEEQKPALEAAAAAYQKALALAGAASAESKYSYALSLGIIQVQLGQPQQALDAYVLAKSLAPPAESWRVDEALARLYAQLGDKTNAQAYANQALASAPQDVQQRIRDLLEQISG